MNTSVSYDNSTKHSTPHTLVYVDINIKKFFHTHAAFSVFRLSAIHFFFIVPTIPSGI